MKISIVKFSFYFVCGITDINWFGTNAFFFRKHTIFLDCMQPFVCFWSVNNSFLIFISIICIIKYSWLKHSCFFDKPSEALKPPILCPIFMNIWVFRKWNSVKFFLRIYTLLHRLENNKRVRFRRSFWF